MVAFFVVVVVVVAAAAAAAAAVVVVVLLLLRHLKRYKEPHLYRLSFWGSIPLIGSIPSDVISLIYSPKCLYRCLK